MARKAEWLLVFITGTLAISQLLDVFNNSAADEGISAVGYMSHVMMLSFVAIYVGLTQYQLRKTREKIKLHRDIWQQLPHAIALITKEGTIEEANGSYVALLKDNEQHLLNLENIMGVIEKGERSHLNCTLMGEAGKLHIERQYIPITSEGKDYVMSLVRDCTHEMETAQDRDRDYMVMLTILVNMFELKDPFGQGHSETVSNISRDIAIALNMRSEEVDTITKAALFHDIGKIVIPPEVLNKQDEFDENDYVAIRRHSEVGAQIVANIGLFHDAAPIILHHHERYDGRGYPDGLKEADIPIGARIIAVVDAFDSMTAGRTARGKRDFDSAMGIIALEKGRQFDPLVVDTFITMLQTSREKVQKN